MRNSYINNYHFENKYRWLFVLLGLILMSFILYKAFTTQSAIDFRERLLKDRQGEITEPKNSNFY